MGTVSNIEYQYGMLRTQNDRSGVKEIVLSELQMTPEIMKCIEDNQLLQASGTYGDPDVGDPIEYDHLSIEHESGITEITFYNRGISLLFGDNETHSQIHRVCCVLRDHERNRGTTLSRGTLATMP